MVAGALGISLAISAVLANVNPAPAGAFYSANGFVDSEWGEYIGNGLTSYYAGGAIISGNASGIAIQLWGSTGAGPYQVDISVVPRTGESLTVGEHSGAQKVADATHPGLDVRADGRQCTTVAGRFFIDDLTFQGGGAVDRVALHFEQHCNGADAAFFGVVGPQSTLPRHGYQRQPGPFFGGPPPLQFGEHAIGGESDALEFYIMNIELPPITVSSVTVTGANPSDFGFDEDCTGAPLQYQDWCTIAVVFHPTGAPGPRSAKLTFFDDVVPAGSSGRDVELRGTAVLRRTSDVPWSQSTQQKRKPDEAFGQSASLSSQGAVDSSGASVRSAWRGRAAGSVPQAVPSQAPPATAVSGVPRFTG